MIPVGKPKTGRPKKGSYREGRDHKLCIRVDKATLRKLDILSKHYGMTKSDYLISEIEMGFEAIFRDYCMYKNRGKMNYVHTKIEAK